MGSKIAIIGAGPAGCACAYFASTDLKDTEVTLFDFAAPLHTLLYTGGGRCNLAYCEYDFKELAKFYPRGEKFLYSVFSKFATSETIDFFKSIGVDTYVQDDLRIFPTSDSAKEVREKILNAIKACGFKKEKVLMINKEENGFLLTTETKTYTFDKVVIAIGGHAGFELAKNIGHTIVKPKPALTSLISKDSLKPLQGVSLKNVLAEVFYENKKTTTAQDDLIFTHSGISGPLAYKISSFCARLDYNAKNPLVLKLNFLQNQTDIEQNFELAFQNKLNANPKKDIKNLVSEFVPKSLSDYILNTNKINPEEKCCKIDGKTRNLIVKALQCFEINITSPAKDGEVVTSGGVCLDEITPKTMQSKLVEGLYFCGEVIDADGLCGGFNLQNCWSTGYIAGNNIV